jgi:choline-sulfatase
METDKPDLLTNQGREPAAEGPMKSLVAGGMHYIHSAARPEELYSLRSDPDERVNMAGSPFAAEVLTGFRTALRAMLGRQ